MTTATLDKAYLEYSNLTEAKTAKEIKLEAFAKKAIKIAKNNHGYHGENDEESCGDTDECIGCFLEEEFKAL